MLDQLRRLFGRSVPGDVDAPAELIAIVRVIATQDHLRAWLARLTALPENVRVSEVGNLVSQMRAAGEDQRTVDAFEMLADPVICRAVQRICQEHLS